MSDHRDAVMQEVLDLFDADRRLNAEEGNRDELVRLLVELRDLRAVLATVAKDIEADLMPLATEKRWVVEGLGEVQVRRANKRTEWDSESLTRVLVARALDERILDESTGEFEASHEAVARVISECSRPSWRLTPLRARGIDETEFCHVEQGAWSIELPPRGN